MDTPDEQQALPFQKHSKTSRIAALEHEPRAGTQRRRVLEWFSVNEPATDDECALALGLLDRSERPRRIELVRGGWMQRLDDKGTTPSGHPASRWGLTPFARRQGYGHE
jgi:hypothetical protein